MATGIGAGAKSENRVLEELIKRLQELHRENRANSFCGRHPEVPEKQHCYIPGMEDAGICKNAKGYGRGAA